MKRRYMALLTHNWLLTNNNGIKITTEMKPKAIVLTDGVLHETDAKTAHGLIRGTERYEIAAVIDSVHAGKDAGEVLDGRHRNIPIYATVEDAVKVIKDIQYCIIGVAT